MIMSGYAKKKNICISEAAQQLLSGNCLDYLEEYYETLHQLSNEDVIGELMDMIGTAA